MIRDTVWGLPLRNPFGLDFLEIYDMEKIKHVDRSGMIRRTALLFAVALFAVLSAGAQGITGVVLDDLGEPAFGATIQLKENPAVGTATDMEGRFIINANEGQKLVISYIGFNTMEVAAKNGMKIQLSSSTEHVDEVVINGMQTVDKRLYSGAATRLNADDMKIDGVPDISRSLEGRVAGVSVQNVSGTFGTAPKIRVRGATSIYGSSRPLWVVDGVILEDVTEVSADQLSSGDAVTLISSAIAGLNSDDIESFDILKDGSATSIYGARAMSGVIVVTTKRGKQGTSSINYTGEYTMRLRPSYNQFNIMDSQEQMGVYKELYNNGWLKFENSYRSSSSGVYGKMFQLMNTYDPETGKFGLPNTPEAMYEYLREAEFRNTNWFDELFSNSLSMNHSVSMSTGTDKAQYYASFSIMKDPGWTKKNEVSRYTANINANYNLSKKLSLNLIGNTSYRKQQAPGTNSSKTNAVTGEVSRDFDINPYSYAINSSRTLDPNEFYTKNYAPFNILYELENNYMDLDVTDMKFQAELKYKPIDKVELSAVAAYKYANTVQQHYVMDDSNYAMAYRAMDDATMRDSNPWLYTDPDDANSLPVSVLQDGGFYRETKYKMNSWSVRATAKYNDVFNDKHILNLFAGTEISDVTRNGTSFNGVGMQYAMGFQPLYDYRYFKQTLEENSLYYSLSNTYNRDLAFFGNANYSYDARYSVNGTVRYEGSNRMGKARNARWLPTWNLSGAWNAHEEWWFKEWAEKTNNAVSNLTFRASYSLTGDKPAVTNAQIMIYSENPWRAFSSDKESALSISSFANNSLTYEKKHELNLGADFGFINNRINVTFDIYWRDNFDLIGPLRTSGEDGSILKYANVADMKSHGEELSISTKNIVKKNFSWGTDFIFSHVNTEVVSLDSRTEIIDLVTGTGFTMEGYPYRSLFSIDYQGLNEKGIPTFINENGELTTTSLWFQSTDLSHLIYEGPTDPTITGSLGNIFNWKGFRLNLFVTYSFGNAVRLDPSFSYAYSDLTASPKEFKNRWVKPGDEAHTDIPAIVDLREVSADSQLRYAYNAYNYSQVRTAKGDFIRMKEISLAYTFPKRMIQNLKINNLSLKLQATNLFLIYADRKLNGQDPEFYNTGGVAIPMPRQFTFTLRFGL